MEASDENTSPKNNHAGADRVIGDDFAPASETADPFTSKSVSYPDKRNRNVVEIVGVAFIGLGFFASTFAAAFSGWQGWTLRDTERRQLRPYLNVQMGALFSSGAPNAPLQWRFPISIENDGLIQTRGATSDIWCTRLPFLGDDPMKQPSIGVLKRFLGPKQTQWAGTCDYTADDLTKARNGEFFLTVAAKIIYHDTFNKHAIRVTEYCATLTGINGDFSKRDNTHHIELLACDIHNCADDECPKEDISRAERGGGDSD